MRLALICGVLCSLTLTLAPLARSETARIVRASDLVGATPSEVRTRLGLKPTNDDYFDRISMTQGGVVTLMRFERLSMPNGGCPEGGAAIARLASGGHSFVQLVFENGRLKDAATKESEVLPLSGDLSLAVTCAARSGGLNPAQRVLYAPIFGLAAAAYRPLPPEQRGRREIARLAIGSPPPGGLEAYADKPPSGVEVERAEPGAAHIRIPYFWRAQAKRTLAIEVRNGVVADIAVDPAEALCSITLTGKIVCD